MNLSIYNRFAGRCLTSEDIMRILNDENINDLLYEWTAIGKVKKELAVKQTSWAMFRTCRRCGAGPSYIEVSACARCGNNACSYCKRCLFYGRVKSCTALYSFPPAPNRDDPCFMEAVLPLAPAHRQTSDKLKSLYESGREQIRLMLIPHSGELFLLIHFLVYLLRKKKRVFWCQKKQNTTKTMEQLTLLMPQLAKYIANTNRSLVLGTKWELLTYYRQFDLIIWDDVLPESFHAWERSIEQNGQQLIICSTFPMGGRPLDMIHPVRLHRYPIPVPKFVRYSNLRRHMRQFKIIPPFHSFVQEVHELDGQALVLVPTKEDVEVTMEWMKRVMPAVANKTCSISGESEEAENIRILFSEQKFMFLLMPQQLADKLKIANLHLCLLYADHPMMDRKRLVELTHLIGLNQYFPACEVWFLGETNTEMIVQTKKEHIYLNELAKKEGYLQKEE